MGFSKYEELNMDNPYKNKKAMDKNKCDELYEYFLALWKERKNELYLWHIIKF